MKHMHSRCRLAKQDSLVLSSKQLYAGPPVKAEPYASNHALSGFRYRPSRHPMYMSMNAGAMIQIWDANLASKGQGCCCCQSFADCDSNASVTSVVVGVAVSPLVSSGHL